jgi:heme/copper-type cytochrome/quinol oxidase subunit 2
MASPVASPGASPVAIAGPGSQVEIEILDGAFQPNALLLRANRDVMLTLVNRGTMVHSFNIDELNIRTGDIQPGQSVTVTINAKPGTYSFYSAVGGQPEPGMTGKFTIS